MMVCVRLSLLWAVAAAVDGAGICPNFPYSESFRSTAAGCEHEIYVDFHWRSDAFNPQTLTPNVLPPGATFKVIEVEKEKRRIPFHAALMPVFDTNADGVLTVTELNNSFAALHLAATIDLQRLSSQGLYTFNYSATSRFPPSQLQPAAEKSKTNGDAVLFADMDSNGDALLSAEEFSLAGEQILTRLMRTFDGNGDNMLARTEAELALRALHLSATEIYTGLALLDVTRDGRLALAEWLRAGQIDLRASPRDALVVQIDNNKDGFLNEAEWERLGQYQVLLQWTPRMQHAGDPVVHRASFASSDVKCSSSHHTVVFEVHKCRYCVEGGDSLRGLAAALTFSASLHPRHWTMIWSLNHDLLDPDHLRIGHNIQIGIMYTASVSDTWSGVTSRFGTSIEALQHLNPDLVNSPSWSAVNSMLDIEEGSNICVMPDTCASQRRGDTSLKAVAS